MAVRMCIATGNFTAAATWAVIDATSYNNVETTTTALTTSYQLSSTFTPGAITIDGIAVKLSVRTGTTGTITVALDKAGVDVAGTPTTINTADLPVAASADLNGGWVFFKFAAPVTLLGATAYSVKAKTSSAVQVSLFSTATTNWARALRTTTTGAPAAGDDLIVTGEYTGAGTSNSFTVTMQQTATTDYGAASTSLVTPALAICSKGILRNGVATGTNYNLKVSGNIIIYSGGEWDIGAPGTEIPRDSSVTINLDCGANVDFGITVRNLGTFVCQGLSRTSGKNIYYCKLNTDEAINSTSLGVDTDTGWLDNDVIVVASTTRTTAQSEAGALNGVAGAATLTVDGFAGAGGGLAFAHGGTSPILAEIILLTRNIVIQGASNSLNSYIDIKPTAIIDWDWTEIKFMGSATANKRGIDIGTTTGSFDMKYCSVHDFTVNSATGIGFSAATGSPQVVQYCVLYNISNTGLNLPATTGTTYVFDNIITILCATNGGSGVNCADVGGTITNITVISSPIGGLSVNEAGAVAGTINNLTAHGCSNSGISLGFLNASVSNITSWRNIGAGVLFTGTFNVIVDTLLSFGNSTTNINLANLNGVVVKNATIAGDTTFSTPTGLTWAAVGNLGSIKFEDSDFGPTTGIYVTHSSRDILPSGGAGGDVILHNVNLLSTEISNQTSMVPGQKIGSQKHDKTAGNHKTFKREGTLTIDTTIFDATPSLRMTPLIATEKLNSLGVGGGFRAGVANGNVLTVSVMVRESVVGDGTDYNGARARLIVKRNAAAGIAADTVLATATVSSEGAFEVLSGATVNVTDDAMLEFFVDCDGTTGWLNIDTWTAA